VKALQLRAARAVTPVRVRAGATCALLVLFALMLALAPLTLRAARATCLLARLTGQSELEPLAKRLLFPIAERLERLPLGAAGVRARRFAPLPGGGSRPGVLLLHGAHPRGIDEPRLREFARALAEGGLDVLTPELPELSAYRLEPTMIERIQQLAAADAAALGQTGVGVIGISFAGGLALLAAASANGGAIAWVATIGAHDDLLRLSDYYAGRDVRGPSGERADVKPHPYGARVMLRRHLASFFSAIDLPLAERALDAYLGDRHAQARHLAQGLSPDGQKIMAVLLDDEGARGLEAGPAQGAGSGARRATALDQARPGGASALDETAAARAAAPSRSASWALEYANTPRLSALLDAAVAEARPQLIAASPHAQLASLHVPVFLLHGADDPIIPSLETRYLAQEVPAAWLRASLITPLLRHAEFPTPPRLRDVGPIVWFLVGMYEAAGSVPARR
jgi:dienelactone hydrolase